MKCYFKNCTNQSLKNLKEENSMPVQKIIFGLSVKPKWDYYFPRTVMLTNTMCHRCLHQIWLG